MAAIVASALQNGLHPREWERHQAQMREVAGELDEHARELRRLGGEQVDRLEDGAERGGELERLALGHEDRVGRVLRPVDHAAGRRAEGRLDILDLDRHLVGLAH
jgi:hypothetical protein